MAVNKNGGIPIGVAQPLATLQTSVDGKAAATEIFELTTTREWLNTAAAKTAGTFSILTSTGTATVFVYDASGELTQQFAITTAASNNVITTTWSRLEAVGSTSLDLSMTRVGSKITTNGGTMSLDFITGSGNYGSGTGTAPGGTSGYASGQLAHVVVVGGGGGGGGGATQGNGGNGSPSGAGGSGGVNFTTTAFPLTGTYSLTVGAAGNAAPINAGQPRSGFDGGNGGSSTGFSLTGTGGTGGQGGRDPVSTPANSGTNGGPNVAPVNTDIALPMTYDYATGGTAGPGGRVNQTAGIAGGAGRILVLRWTP